MTAQLFRPATTSARISVTALVLAKILAMSLWFISTALLREVRAEVVLSAAQAAALATAVQARFVLAALALAALGLALLATLLWGASVIPASAQFSTLVADAAPAEPAGSLMTFQIAASFLLSAIDVQVLLLVAVRAGSALALLLLVPGPIVGAVAMPRLIALQRSPGAG